MKLKSVHLFSWISIMAVLLFTSVNAADRQTEFVILITSYNNEKFAEENLQSACFLKSTYPYKVIYVNDASTDRTKEIVENFRTKNNLSPMLTIINNSTNQGGVINYYNVIHEYIEDEKIVVNLDGDDILEESALLTLEKYYDNPDIWMTYGSARSYPAKKPLPYMSRPYPNKVIKKKKFRNYAFIAQHLRTFKAWLFKKIVKDDLYYQGSPIKGAPDMAFMIPMLEMSSPANSKGKTIPSLFQKFFIIGEQQTRSANLELILRDKQQKLVSFNQRRNINP